MSLHTISPDELLWTRRARQFPLAWILYFMGILCILKHMTHPQWVWRKKIGSFWLSFFVSQKSCLQASISWFGTNFASNLYILKYSGWCCETIRICTSIVCRFEQLKDVRSWVNLRGQFHDLRQFATQYRLWWIYSSKRQNCTTCRALFMRIGHNISWEQTPSTKECTETVHEMTNQYHKTNWLKMDPNTTI